MKRYLVAITCTLLLGLLGGSALSRRGYGQAEEISTHDRERIAKTEAELAWLRSEVQRLRLREAQTGRAAALSQTDHTLPSRAEDGDHESLEQRHLRTRVEPPDPERELAQTQEEFEDLAEARRGERRDETWAARLEERAQKELADARTKIELFACGNSICELRASHEDPATANWFRMVLGGRLGPELPTVRVMEDGNATVAFFAREGRTVAGITDTL